MEELYSDWVETNTKRFERTKQEVESKGRVEGLEMSLIQPEWEMTSGDDLEDWQELERSEQEEIMDGETAYQISSIFPRRKIILLGLNGLNVIEIGTQEVGGSFGTYLDSKDRKTYNEYWNKKWYANDWIRPYPVNWSPDSKKIVAVEHLRIGKGTSNESGLSVQCGWIQLESTRYWCVGRTER